MPLSKRSAKSARKMRRANRGGGGAGRRRRRMHVSLIVPTIEAFRKIREKDEKGK